MVRTIDLKNRIFEVRGTHNEYKPPEVKKTDIHKLTQTAQNHLALNISVMNKTGMSFKKRELSAVKKNRGFSGMSKRGGDYGKVKILFI